MGMLASTARATPPADSARAASAPPADTATSAAPRSSAVVAPASVSAVEPENERATTSVRGPTKPGSTLSFSVTTGTGLVGPTRAATTSPAMPLPPIPTSRTWSMSSAEGRPPMGAADRGQGHVQLVGQPERDVPHPEGVEPRPRTPGPGHPPAPGAGTVSARSSAATLAISRACSVSSTVSASSGSITGIPSRMT